MHAAGLKLTSTARNGADIHASCLQSVCVWSPRCVAAAGDRAWPLATSLHVLITSLHTCAADRVSLCIADTTVLIAAMFSAGCRGRTPLRDLRLLLSSDALSCSQGSQGNHCVADHGHDPQVAAAGHHHRHRDPRPGAGGSAVGPRRRAAVRQDRRLSWQCAPCAWILLHLMQLTCAAGSVNTAAETNSAAAHDRL